MLKIETVQEMPDVFTTGKWNELFVAAEKMVIGQVIRITVENRKEAVSAQANLQGSHSFKGQNTNTLRNKGFRFSTRTRPVNDKDGQWFLFIKRIA